MSTIADRLDAETRKRLLGRLDELQVVDHLMRQPGTQQPSPPPRPLAAIAAHQEVSEP